MTCCVADDNSHELIDAKMGRCTTVVPSILGGNLVNFKSNTSEDKALFDLQKPLQCFLLSHSGGLNKRCV